MSTSRESKRRPLDAMRAIFKPSDAGFVNDLTTPQRLVLAALVVHADNETGRCDPSLATLAEGTGLGRSTVIRTLQQLHDDGHIERLLRPGQRTVYIVHPSRSGTRPGAGRVQERDGGGPRAGRDPSRSGTRTAPTAVGTAHTDADASGPGARSPSASRAGASGGAGNDDEHLGTPAPREQTDAQVLTNHVIEVGLHGQRPPDYGKQAARAAKLLEQRALDYWLGATDAMRAHMFPYVDRSDTFDVFDLARKGHKALAKAKHGAASDEASDTWEYATWDDGLDLDPPELSGRADDSTG